MKICNKCKKEKSNSLFYRHIKSKDGLRNTCMECMKTPRNEYVIVDSKKCFRCKNIKNISEFYKNKLNKTGHDSICKECSSNKSSNFKIIEYGITVQEYNDMLETQDFKCAICSKEQDNISLSIDHNHTTGKVRGLLCNSCNMALGLFQDSTRILLMAATYLESNN